PRLAHCPLSFSRLRPHPPSTLFPYTTLFRSAEATAAYAVDLQPKLAAAKNATVSRRSPIAPHFVDYVWDQLEQHYDPSYLRQGGLKIITTLDVATQQMAQKSITDGVRSFASGYHVNNGAMLVMNPHTGEVSAMIGSADY